jgi:hypothetical protein
MVVVEGREPAPLAPEADGFHYAAITGVGEGARYGFQVGDLEFPDLVWSSRF